MHSGETPHPTRQLSGVELQTNLRRRLDKRRKKRGEGSWAGKATLIGFEVDTANMMVQLPDEKIQQARSLVLSVELAPGNYAVTIKTLQHLRGLCASVNMQYFLAMSVPAS